MHPTEASRERSPHVTGTLCSYPRFHDRLHLPLSSASAISGRLRLSHRPFSARMTSSSSGPMVPALDPRSKDMPKSSPCAQPPSHAHRLLILSLRYAISPKEYSIVRRRLLLKGPSAIASRTPSKSQFEDVCNSAEDYVPAATRTGLRVFLVSSLVLSLWDVVLAKLAKRRGGEELYGSWEQRMASRM